MRLGTNRYDYKVHAVWNNSPQTLCGRLLENVVITDLPGGTNPHQARQEYEDHSGKITCARCLYSWKGFLANYYREYVGA